MASDPPAEYLECDEYSDALNTMRHAAQFFAASRHDDTMLKWAVIALHNALQASMICHLSGTAGLGALRTDSVKAALEWHEANRSGTVSPYPEEKVADANELFKRLIGEANAREQAGGVLAVSADEKRAFDRLHSLRKDFAHFSPKTWVIYIDGIPDIFGHIAAVTERIVDAGYAFRHAQPDLIARARTALATFRDRA